MRDMSDECETCGAMVANSHLHALWHVTLNNVEESVDDATNRVEQLSDALYEGRVLPVSRRWRFRSARKT